MAVFGVADRAECPHHKKEDEDGTGDQTFHRRFSEREADNVLTEIRSLTRERSSGGARIWKSMPWRCLDGVLKPSVEKRKTGGRKMSGRKIGGWDDGNSRGKTM